MIFRGFIFEEKEAVALKAMVVIPAYNEGESIYDVVCSVQDHGVDVVVVDDGSLDNTAAEARRAGATVIELPQNLGIGGAVQTGYLYAQQNDYDAVVQIDGDGQHDAKDLPQLLGLLESGGADMAIGSRFVAQTAYKPSFFRNIGIHYFANLITRLIGQKVTDTTSGYRAVNRKVIALFARYYPSDYPEGETIVIAAGQGAKIRELSVDMQPRQGGESSITPWKSFYYMFKVTFCLLLTPRPKRKTSTK